MDYAAEFDWPGYFNAVAGKEARETLVKALSLFDAEDALASKKQKTKSARPSTRTAIDIGCGEGRDTRALLRHKGAIPWSLLVSDGSAKGIDILLDSLRPAEHARICAVQCMMELLPEIYATAIPIGLHELPTPQVDLINASFSLPFCSPRELTTLWAWIAAHIRPGGRFAGQLFGDRDTWPTLARPRASRAPHSTACSSISSSRNSARKKRTIAPRWASSSTGMCSTSWPGNADNHALTFRLRPP